MVCQAHEGASDHKDYLLKYAMSRTVCPKYFNRMKKASGFSHCKNSSIITVDRATANVFTDEDKNSIFYRMEIIEPLLETQGT